MRIHVPTLTALAFSAIAWSSAPALADDAPRTHLGTPAQQAAAAAWNQARHSALYDAWNVLRPFSEVEKSGYVAISGEDDYELPQLREAIAKNLPQNVTMIVYTADSSRVDEYKANYGPYLGDRLKFVQVDSGGDPIWARDSLPFPVYLKTGTSAAPAFGLVGSIYPQQFDPNAALQKALGIPMQLTNTYFRGGNLLFDEAGNCFAENANEVADLTDAASFFKQYFGCTTVTILDQEGGIGDIDERIKFLDGKVALTDNDNYAQLLQGKGYDVKRIPQTGNGDETYMNTLLVNGTIFVPQMGIDRDAEAVQAYKDLGFNAVGVYTKQLADQGAGNIHCTTMNYPAGTFRPTPRPDFLEFAVDGGR